MSISLDEVKITATLARLHLSEDECRAMQAELGKVLTYAEQLQEASIEEVAPTTHVLPISCPMRADEVGPQLQGEVALRGAPVKEGVLFEVPAILPKEQEG